MSLAASTTPVVALASLGVGSVAGDVLSWNGAAWASSTFNSVVPAQIAAGNGTVGAPAYSFASDTNTGFYRIGADELGLSLGGALCIDFKTTGIDMSALKLANVGRLGLGVAFAAVDLDTSFDFAGGFAYGIYKHGTIATASGASAAYGFWDSSTYAFAASLTTICGFLAKAAHNMAAAQTATSISGFTASPQFSNHVGIITTAYGFCYDGGSAITGGGSIGTAYGGYFAAPTAGTTKYALWAADCTVGGARTNTSCGLELNSTTKAFLPSRMTTGERDALTAVNGMIIYNTSTGALNYYKAGVWTAI